MNVAAICLLLAALDAGAAPPPDPDAPTVGAALDRSEAHVGDRLTLTVSAVSKGGIAVTLPAKLELGKLEVVERQSLDRDLGDGRRSRRFVLGVTAYELGDLEVPPIELSYLNPRGDVHTVKTEPLTLHVRPLVGEDETKPEAQPLRPPREALVEDRRVMSVVRWTLGSAASLLAFMIGFVLVRRSLTRRRAPTEAGPAVPTRPPDEVAIEKLRALRAAGQFSADGYRPFYFAVAEVVRAYLGARYRFDSLELTTSELLDELTRRAPHLAAEGGEVARFLAETDLVKFANVGSTDPAALAVLGSAESLVLSTAAPLETVAQSISGPVRLPRPPSEGTNG